MTVMASAKANIIKQGMVETALAANKTSLEMERYLTQALLSGHWVLVEHSGAGLQCGGVP